MSGCDTDQVWYFSTINKIAFTTTIRIYRSSSGILWFAGTFVFRHEANHIIFVFMADDEGSY